MRATLIGLLTIVNMGILGCGASNNRQSKQEKQEAKDTYWRDEAKRVSISRAVFELNCPEDQITLHELTVQKIVGSYFFQFGVEGCGNREIYQTSCVHGSCSAVNEKVQQGGQSLPPTNSTFDNPPGTPPGSPPGTLPGAPLGSPPGTLPGTPPGSMPGTMP